MEFTIKLSPQQLNIVGAALGRLPHDDVRETIERIAAQVREQQERAAKVKPLRPAKQSEQPATDAQ